MTVYAVIQPDIEGDHVVALYQTREDAELHIEFVPRPRSALDLHIVEWQPWENFDQDRFTKKRYLRAEFYDSFSPWGS